MTIDCLELKIGIQSAWVSFPAVSISVSGGDSEEGNTIIVQQSLPDLLLVDILYSMK